MRNEKAVRAMLYAMYNRLSDLDMRSLKQLGFSDAIYQIVIVSHDCVNFDYGDYCHSKLNDLRFYDLKNDRYDYGHALGYQFVIDMLDLYD